MPKKSTKRLLLAGSMLTLALVATTPSLAATKVNSNLRRGGHSENFLRKNFSPATIGTVTAINGNSITMTSKNGTSYTVDATTTKITKADATTTLANIQVGDSLFVRGTTTGTNIVATNIIDGITKAKGFEKNEKHSAKANLYFGTIAAVNGSSFTIQGESRSTTTAVTVNTDSATVFTKDGQTASLGDLTVGQRVTVKGTKDNTTKTISSVTNVNVMTAKPILRNDNFKNSNLKHKPVRRGGKK